MAAQPMVTTTQVAHAGHADEFTSDLVAARVTVAHVARWARRYLTTRGGGAADGACCCGTPRCELADVPGGAEACRLAVDLARLPVGEAEAAKSLGGDAQRDDVAALYLHALRGAAGAVYYCQRVQHVMGDCWLTIPGTRDQTLCARTLALAHLLRNFRRTLL